MSSIIAAKPAPARFDGDDAYRSTISEVIDRLGTDRDLGLSPESAAERLTLFGRNELPRAKGPGILRRWLDQVRNPLVIVLLGAAAVTLAIGHYVDASVIAGVVVLNAVVGYLQESRAREALDSLSKLVRTSCIVVRAGGRRTVASEELVPGDVVLFEAGDRVPADVRLIEARDLECDESALTGESVPAAKSVAPLPAAVTVADRTNMAFSGTMVTRGAARAVVTATGESTEIGLVRGLVASATAPLTPLTRKLTRFSKQLTVVIIALAAVTFGIGVWRGSAPADMLIAAVALAVGAIPEGLPAAATVVLAIGVVRMARRRAIVRHLPAVETLGGTTIICSDKTGTITANAMTVVEVFAGGERYAVTGSGFAPEGMVNHRDVPVDLLGHPAFVECLVTGVLCNDAELRRVDGTWRAVGDPTEAALLTVATKAGLDWASLRAGAPRLDVLPFESGRRLMATLHAELDGAVIGHVKGAAERVVGWCHQAMAADGTSIAVDADAMLAEVHALAARGLRVLAIARYAVPDGIEHLTEEVLRGRLTLLGLIAMRDVPRPGVTEAVRACQNAGIAVKMITGDHAATARAVAAEIGLGVSGDPLVCTGDELAGRTDDELDEVAIASDVFARVAPEQKLRLVESFQRHGHVVAMTGDGVNDAPALRRADIGVAMGLGGTEVARDAADMVLADDDFSTIEAAVEEGRGAFDNLRKFITWTLPTNLAEGLVIVAAVLFGAALPILPVQILWINMTTAVFLGLTLAFEPKAHGTMLRPPRPPARPLLTADLVRRIVLVSAVLVAGAFVAFELQLRAGEPAAAARTAAINVFVCAEIAFLLNCRSLDRTRPRGRNRWVFGGIALMVVLQLLLTYVGFMQALFHTAALNASGWLLAGAVGVLTFIVVKVDSKLWQPRPASS